FEYLRLRLADADAADGVTVKLHRDDGPGAFLAQRGAGAALDDPENQLARRERLITALLGPANGPLHGCPHFARRAAVRRAVVKRHRDVRAERALSCHRFFRTEEQQRAIQVGAELDAVGLDL